MNQEEYAVLSRTMTTELIGGLDEVMKSLYDSHGIHETNACFANALALAVGSMISAYCFMCDLNRKNTLDLFNKVMRTAAHRHHNWKLTKNNSAYNTLI